MSLSFKLGIDWGEKWLGVALSRLSDGENEIIYPGTLLAEEKWLKEKVSRRAGERRLRRTKKSKEKRLKLIKKVLESLALDPQLNSFLISFCKRRGFDYTDEEETEGRKEGEAEEKRYSFHRNDVITALSKELANKCPTRAQEILNALVPVLNRQIRPKRFFNRNTSKCQWQDCTRNTPKKANSIEETLILELYPKLRPFLLVNNTKVENFKEVEARIEGFIKEATKLEEELSDLCKVFKKDMSALVVDKERFKKVWKDGKVSESIRNIIRGKPAGRQTFCREHVKEFKEFFLAGKEIPKRKEIRESDLTKRQEILFSKLFAFIKGRLLPLTNGHGIAEITVERNAFDVVPRKYRPHKERIGDKVVQKGLSEDKLGELYWYGPKYEFESERDMFFKEFGGKCAYCNNPIDKDTYEVEHIFPRKDFPMDAYLNKVPTCQACNRKKGIRTILEARMPIHPEAYRAYEGYLKERGSKLPAHYLMNAKKGLLNLLKGVNGGFWGEQPESNFAGSFEEGELVRMLGRNLVSQARTQSSTRMLGRYLATKLESFTGQRPRLESFDARSVALVRKRFCPDFSKEIEAKNGHALDAAILSCKWPSLNTPIRGKDGKERWEFDVHWNDRFNKKWPTNIKEDGTIELSSIKPVSGFEEPLGKGGFFINLSNTNWNPREMSVADQTIYSVKHSVNGTIKPTVRKPARDWLNELLKEKDPVEPVGHIEKIVHPNLRGVLLETFKRTNSKAEVEKAIKGWLRKSVRAGLTGPKPSHPSSRARWKELEDFAKGGEDIPPTVGLRRVREGIEAGIKRMDKGMEIHALRAQPSYRYWQVAYRRDKPDKERPLVIGVKQPWAVEVVYGDKKGLENIIENKTCLKNGRAYRDKEKEKEFLKRWEKEMAESLGELGYRHYCRVHQGNVILYEDGHSEQVKNFKEARKKGKKIFCNISKVYRSPYNFVLKKTC